MKYPNRTTAAVLAAGAVLTCLVALVAGQAGAQEKQMTIAMITHAQPGDTFWDIIRKGAEAAAKKDNIKLIYLADPTATKEAQLISNVVEQHVDGIALTLAFPDAEASAVKAAQRAGIPLVGFNAGVDQWKSQGLLGYAGQDETVAGKAVGEELNKEGAKNVVCLDQQQGAVQLEARCNGIKDTFKGKMEVLYVTGYASSSAMLATLRELAPRLAAWAAKSTRGPSGKRLLNEAPPQLRCNRSMQPNPPLSSTTMFSFLSSITEVAISEFIIK